MTFLQGLKYTAFYAMVPSIGGGAMIGAAKVATLYGVATKYGVIKFLEGSENIMHLGVIGAVNQLVSLLLFSAIEQKHSSFKEYLFAHTITPLAILGATTLAARVNLIAFNLSLFGTIALFATGVVGNLIPLIGSYFDLV